MKNQKRWRFLIFGLLSLVFVGILGQQVFAENGSLNTDKQSDRCNTAYVSGTGNARGNDGTIYRRYVDFRRGRESINSAACGREYWISPNSSNHNYGVRFVYLVDGREQRVVPDLYYEASDGSLRPFTNVAEARVPNPFAGDLGLTTASRNPPTPPTPPAPSTPIPRNSPAPATAGVGNYSGELLELTNQQRANGGVARLSLSTELGRAAQKHAEDMVNSNFFSHTGSDGSSVPDRARREGYRFSTIGENIAMGTEQTPRGAIEGWMNSPGHRRNILNPNFTEIGLGVARQGRNVYYVQVFGRS